MEEHGPVIKEEGRIAYKGNICGKYLTEHTFEVLDNSLFPQTCIKYLTFA
jgi:hypothetical protein